MPSPEEAAAMREHLAEFDRLRRAVGEQPGEVADRLRREYDARIEKLRADLAAAGPAAGVDEVPQPWTPARNREAVRRLARAGRAAEADGTFARVFGPTDPPSPPMSFPPVPGAEDVRAMVEDKVGEILKATREGKAVILTIGGEVVACMETAMDRALPPMPPDQSEPVGVPKPANVDEALWRVKFRARRGEFEIPSPLAGGPPAFALGEPRPGSDLTAGPLADFRVLPRPPLDLPGVQVAPEVAGDDGRARLLVEHAAPYLELYEAVRDWLFTISPDPDPNDWLGREFVDVRYPRLRELVARIDGQAPAK